MTKPIATFHYAYFRSGQWSWIRCYTLRELQKEIDLSRSAAERFYIEWHDNNNERTVGV